MGRQTARQDAADVLAWHRRDEMSNEGRHRSFVMHRDKFLDIALHPPDVPEARALADRFAVVEGEDGGRYDMSQKLFSLPLRAQRGADEQSHGTTDSPLA